MGTIISYDITDEQKDKLRRVMSIFGMFRPKTKSELVEETPKELKEDRLIGEYFDMIEVKEIDNGKQVQASLTRRGRERLDELETIDDVLDYLRTVTAMFEATIDHRINGTDFTNFARTAAYKLIMKNGLDLLRTKRDEELKGKW